MREFEEQSVETSRYRSRIPRRDQFTEGGSIIVPGSPRPDKEDRGDAGHDARRNDEADQRSCQAKAEVDASVQPFSNLSIRCSGRC